MAILCICELIRGLGSHLRAWFFGWFLSRETQGIYSPGCPLGVTFLAVSAAICLFGRHGRSRTRCTVRRQTDWTTAFRCWQRSADAPHDAESHETHRRVRRLIRSCSLRTKVIVGLLDRGCGQHGLADRGSTKNACKSMSRRRTLLNTGVHTNEHWIHRGPSRESSSSDRQTLAFDRQAV